MSRTKLIISAVLLFSTSTVSGQRWLSSGVQIFPENPTSSDVVNITLSGQSPDTCVPVFLTGSVVGSDIYFDLIELGSLCFMMPTDWSLTEQVGPLEPGSYSLYVSLLDNDGVQWPYTLRAEFDVTYSGDIDISYDVDFLDFDLFAQAWMSGTGDLNWDARCDISEPKDGVIDGRDLAVLAEDWLAEL